MELSDVIANRRSIRNFKKEDISKEVIEDILNCGRFAPSAKNRQPWHFVVLKSDIKDAIANLMLEYEKNINKYNSVKETANAIKQAPILILIFKKKEDDWLIGDNLSIGACVENICLRATDLGLGSLWIRDIVYVSKIVAEMLKYENMELNCAVSLGVPNQNPSQTFRKELKDIMEWY